ncbi:YncE family protein [Clostridium guangxiense]|uniref:YncE family protein n=1 Tax=Clostridium guangxiense TaxID=1662055 RepID=UPI001E459BBF|nr:YncE family protein [Clostridium guangxiense]MCD2345422.1 YncE family protein [Clostridium guangxiense]
MSFVYICNSGSDDVSVIDPDSLLEIRRINLKQGLGRVGPHAACKYMKGIVVANAYSNTLTLIDFSEEKVHKDYFIGMRCSDVKIFNNNAYVACSDSNTIIRYDLKNEMMEEAIPCGVLPHSIDFNAKNKMFVTSNMLSSDITTFYSEDTNEVNNIRVGEYPTKAIFTHDGENIIVSESNIGTDHVGSINIISVRNKLSVSKIKVGKWPVDIWCSDKLLFAVNFGDGTVSIINLKNFKEIKRIYLGGMLRGIIQYKNKLLVNDNYNNVLIGFDILKNKKKIVPIGKEPTGIIIF